MQPGTPVKKPSARMRHLAKSLHNGRLVNTDVFADKWVDEPQLDFQLSKAPQSVKKGEAKVLCLDLSDKADQKIMENIIACEANESNPRGNLLVTHRTIVPPDPGSKNFRALITYRKLKFQVLEQPEQATLKK